MTAHELNAGAARWTGVVAAARTGFPSRSNATLVSTVITGIRRSRGRGPAAEGVELESDGTELFNGSCWPFVSWLFYS